VSDPTAEDYARVCKERDEYWTTILHLREYIARLRAEIAMADQEYQGATR